VIWLKKRSARVLAARRASRYAPAGEAEASSG
jgi:hypothetical protein